MFAQTAAKIAFVTAVLAASPAAVFAAAPVTAQVRLNDLDLASPAGHAALMGRVHQAAAAVCGGDEAHRSLGDQQTYLTCRSETIANAMPQLHAAIASAEHPEQYAMVRHTHSESTVD
ncbi:MAG TPA: UrcA family protein [Magnetospirillaceae bacterium]|nr:UrcA family protein [Magnetospirillaceae bacterium]